MALRWFRQNKRFTRWVYLIITIFVMLTFSVTLSVEQFFSCAGDPNKVAGRFETNGNVHEIHGNELTALRQNMERLGMVPRERADEAVWQFLMTDTLAKEAGFVVTDGMLRDFLKSAVGVESQEQFKTFTSAYQISPIVARELLSSALRVSLYSALMRDEDRPTSDQVFTRFKQDNELISLRAITFDDDAFAAKLDPKSVSEDDLKKFYSDELAATIKTNEYSTPEKYVLDAAIADPATATLESLNAVLPAGQQAVTDEDLENWYDDNRELWRKPAASQPAASEPAASEPAKDEDVDEDADENFLPLADVKDDVKKRILVERVVEEAAKWFRDEHDKQKKEAAAAAASQPADPAKPADPANPADPSKPESPETPPASAPAPPDLFPQMCEKFHLTAVSFNDPVTKDGLKDLAQIGTDTQLAQYTAFLTAGDVTERSPDDELKFGYVLRMKERIAPVALPFDEVKDKLRETWKKETAKKDAQKAADDFRAALKEKAREKVKDDVTKLEDAARAAGEKAADDQKITDPAERQKQIDAQLAMKKPEIDALIAGHEGEVFDAVVAERGVTAVAIPEFRKNYHRTLFWNDDAPSAARFLQSQELVFAVQKGGVFGPVRDDTTHAVYVCQVADRREPTFEEMRLGDRARAEAMLSRSRFNFPGMQMPGGTGLTFERLATELRLERPTQNQDGESSP